MRWAVRLRPRLWPSQGERWGKPFSGARTIALLGCWYLPSVFPLPSPGQYLPAGQGWQALGEGAPSRGFRVPSGQGRAEDVPPRQ